MGSIYGLKEPQSITAHTRLRSNLGCFSPQRSEGLHPVIKVFAIGIPTISQTIEKITEQIEDLVLSHQQEMDGQKRNLPRSSDQSRAAFAEIAPYITYKTIEMVHWQWNITKRLYKDHRGILSESM